jgi:hypothetical protein
MNTTGQAVPGTSVPSSSLVTPGGAQGVQGIQGPTAVSANAGNQATLGTDNLIYVPDPTPVITSVRLRSFSSIGNGNFECDQRQIHSYLTNPANGTFVCDRWQLQKSALTAAINLQSWTAPFTGSGIGGPILIPGTSYRISQNVLLLGLATAQATLAAGDYFAIQQSIEGPMLRELASDVHSVSLLIQSDVVPLSFGLILRDPGGTVTLSKLCTVNATGYNLIKLPNLPVWASGGNFSVTPGAAGYTIFLSFACGTTYISPANDVWQTGNFIGAPGMTNWLANPVNSAIRIAFVQHEPGAQCTTLIDKPFSQNLDECLRYYTKSYPYGVAPGAVNTAGCVQVFVGLSLSPEVYIAFPRVMAKTPTVTVYGPNLANAAGYIWDTSSSTNRSISAVITAGDRSFSGVSLTTPNTVQSLQQFQWTADTGW